MTVWAIRQGRLAEEGEKVVALLLAAGAQSARVSAGSTGVAAVDALLDSARPGDDTVGG